MAINVASITGNVTRDAELRSTQSGTTVVSFSLAVNERRKNQDGEWADYANYFDCKIFGKRADAVYPFIKKGRKLGVSGRLHQDRWKDKEGNTRSKVEIIVDEIDFMSGGEQKKPRREEGYAQAYEDDSIPF